MRQPYEKTNNPETKQKKSISLQKHFTSHPVLSANTYSYSVMLQPLCFTERIMIVVMYSILCTQSIASYLITGKQFGQIRP